MRYAFVLMLLAGCSTTEPGRNVGPYTPAAHDTPSCSQVTVSNHAGKKHWPECDVR
jgi:uncharacterized lipoprotein YajG